MVCDRGGFSSFWGVLPPRPPRPQGLLQMLGDYSMQIYLLANPVHDLLPETDPKLCSTKAEKVREVEAEKVWEG